MSKSIKNKTQQKIFIDTQKKLVYLKINILVKIINIKVLVTEKIITGITEVVIKKNNNSIKNDL